MQLIRFFQKTFQDAHIPVWLHSYKILSTSKSTGLIELIPDAISIDGLKKKPDFPGDLRTWYQQSFGYRADATVQDERYKHAIENYIASMAGYSILAYLLAIKDR
jgi:phosphatidylinositol 4-kinase